MTQFRSRFCIGLVLVLLGMPMSWAQTPTGAIEGTITDPSGAVVPNAKVTVSEAATGRVINTTTNSAGFYSIRNLIPGVYNVRLETQGFAVKEIKAIRVDSGAVYNASLALELGKTGEIVEVSASAVVVDTARQTLDSVIQDKEVKALPLFSRNFMDLAILSPGVTIRDGEAIDPTKAFGYRAVSINGRSGTGTRVQVDGVDVTDETVGTTTANISNEALSQFQISRSSLDVSTSLTSSGAVNIITSSGSNALHGSWFYDYYNQDMGARPNYEPESPTLNRKRTGGSVGGRFIKDKLFWYANWERTWQSTINIVRVPEFPSLNSTQGFPTRLQYAIGRLDWNVTQSSRLFYKWQHNDDLSTGGSAISPFQNINWTNNHVVGYDFNFARTTNAIRFGYTNFNNQIASQELNTKFPVLNGQQYQLNLGPFSWGPNGLAPQATYQDNFQFSYDGSYVRSKHTFRYGANYTRINLGGFANFAGPLTVNGVYDEATIASIPAAQRQNPLVFPLESFSTGPANGFFTLAAGHGLAHGYKVNNRSAFWVGDSWKPMKNLVLNFAVRWQYDSGFFPNDKRVKRDPVLARWGRGFDKFPEAPKNLWSPSFGFAWDPTGSGKTSIRGGFYRAYEMNIFNNTLFDEFAMLPAGIGPDSYDITGVFGPDGRPINVDGRHPDGDYSDLIGQPMGTALPQIIRVHQALQAAYASQQFDPNKGTSQFTNGRGNVFGGTVPGTQFKAPYALQFNIGVQREIMNGVVLSADYVENRGVGLPYFLVDFERRRDAGTLNVAAARTAINRVLGTQTMDQYLAANPTATIGRFGLANDTVFAGLYPDFLRARFFQGGFTRYRGLQLNLRGRFDKEKFKFQRFGYNLSYAFGRSEVGGGADRPEFLVGPFDNRAWNSKASFGPNSLDFRHILSGSFNFSGPFGLQMGSLWQFRSAPARTLTVPNLGGAVSGANGIFGTDLNGDGGAGTTPRGDILPGLGAGGFGRKVGSLKELNDIITAFNTNFAGKITPAGQALVSAGLFTEAQLRRLGAVTQAIPLVPDGTPNPWHNIFRTDLQISRPIKIKGERVVVKPFADIFNLFNHNPAAIYGSLTGRFGALNYNYAAAPAGQKASDLNLQRGRIQPLGNRQVQIGVRVDF